MELSCRCIMIFVSLDCWRLINRIFLCFLGCRTRQTPQPEWFAITTLHWSHNARNFPACLYCPTWHHPLHYQVRFNIMHVLDPCIHYMLTWWGDNYNSPSVQNVCIKVHASWFIFCLLLTYVEMWPWTATRFQRIPKWFHWSMVSSWTRSCGKILRHSSRNDFWMRREKYASLITWFHLELGGACASEIFWRNKSSFFSSLPLFIASTYDLLKGTSFPTCMA